MKNQDGPQFVVGIASSAGGLKPLMELIKNSKCHGNMCFILVPHLSRIYESNLPQLLSRVSNLPAKTITDGMSLEHCRLFILPPNHYVEVKNEKLWLQKRETGGSNQSANILFKSLANSYKNNSIGVVLSGSSAGSDGAEGILAIKEAGGHTYAQSPETAEFPAMPQLAIKTGAIDAILSPDEIGNELTLVNWALSKKNKKLKNSAQINNCN